MKCILHVCALLFLGCAMGGDEGCRLDLQDGMDSLRVLVTRSTLNCLGNINIPRVRELILANTTEELRAAFKHACDKRRDFTACLAAVETDVEQCFQEGAEKRKLLLHIGLQHTMFEVECMNDGERNLIIEQEGRKLYANHPLGYDETTGESTYRPGVMSTCIYRFHSVFHEPSNTINGEMGLWFFYVRHLIACLEKHRGGEQDTLVNASVAQWTEILNKMRCWDETEGKEVFCKTILDAN